MPLLKKQPFVKKGIPLDLKEDEEVFFCPLTQEIFRDYEEFFERIIVCNSLVWTCSISGRFGLTYHEALESEQKALKCLESFPESLQKPILYLASLTQRGTLNDMCDDVFIFARDRYFVDETVHITINGQKKICHIVKVIPPSKEEISKSLKNSFTSNPNEMIDPNKQFHPLANLYKYLVKEMNAPNTKSLIVKAHSICRQKGLYTRVKNKLFLKQHTTLEKRTRVVKEEWVKKYNLNNLEFSNIFTTELPEFSNTPSKKLYTLDSTESKGDIDSSRNANTKVSNKSTLLVSYEHNNNEITKRKLSPEEEADNQRLLDMEQRKVEREQKREEVKAKAEYLKAWNKPRDDLECDDLKPLPPSSKIPTYLTGQCFADALVVLEFIASFGELLDVKDNFPDGLSFDQIERALLSDESNGPYFELLQFFLSSIFHLQSEEEHPNEFQNESEEMTEELKNQNELVRKATLSSNLAKIRYGLTLKELLRLDSNAHNMSEILRLHLLASGGLGHHKNALYRYQQRGAYIPKDDPGLELKLIDPVLVKHLSTTFVFELTPEQKGKILCTLISQLLTFVTLREYIEENLEKVRNVKIDIRTHNSLVNQNNSPNLVNDESCVGALEGIVNVTNETLESDKNNSSLPMSKEELYNKLDFHQTRGALFPLGRDRSYKRFWILNVLPGLYIEDFELEPGECVTYSPTPLYFPSKDVDGFNESLIQNDKEEKCDIKVKPEYVMDNGLGFDINKFMNHLLVRVDQNVNNIIDQDRCLPYMVINRKLDILEELKSNINNNYTYSSDNKSRIITKEEPLDEDLLRLERILCTGFKAVCPVHSTSEIRERLQKSRSVPLWSSSNDNARSIWSVFSDHDAYSSLLNCLNKRGFREKYLRAILLERKLKVTASISKCDETFLIRKGAIPTYDHLDNKNDYIGNIGREAEIEFRDSLLDLEERVFTSGLGHIYVTNRNTWRIALEEDKYDDEIFNEVQDVSDYDESFKYEIENPIEVDENHKLKCFANCLLQISKGIDTRFLQCPLGEDEKTKQNRVKNVLDANAKNEANVFTQVNDTKLDSSIFNIKEQTLLIPPMTQFHRKWEHSLHQRFQNLSQLFLHLMVLDKSITWSKSLLKVRCKICRKKNNPEQLLLCDGCNKGHHTYCVKPKIKKIPDGDWFCPSCKKSLLPSTNKKIRQYNHIMTTNQSSNYELVDDNSDASSTLTNNTQFTPHYNSEDDNYKKNLVTLKKNNLNTVAANYPFYCCICGGDENLTQCYKCPTLVHHPQCSVSIDAKNINKDTFLCHKCSIDKDSMLSKSSFEEMDIGILSNQSSSQISLNDASDTTFSITQTTNNLVLNKRGRGRGRGRSNLKRGASGDIANQKNLRGGMSRAKITPSPRRLLKSSNAASPDSSATLTNNVNPIDYNDIASTHYHEHELNAFYSRSGRKIKRTSKYEDSIQDLISIEDPQQLLQMPQTLSNSANFHHTNINLSSGKRGRKRKSINDTSENPLINNKTPNLPDFNVQDTLRKPSIVINSISSFQLINSCETQHTPSDNSQSRLIQNTEFKVVNGMNDEDVSDNGEDLNDESDKLENRDSASNVNSNSSTFSRSQTNGFNREQKHREEIIQSLKKHPDSWPFLKPVSKIKVPDYYVIIKKPMDLGTLKSRVDSIYYQDMASFLSDLRLVFTNSWLYNSEDAPEYKAALGLEKFLKYHLKCLCLIQHYPSSESDIHRNATDNLKEKIEDSSLINGNL
ncbi:unnamed protein product [Gordionus sp. m RMFG-2023]|uniref:bromodomain adjacent to zinc finger domain protein 1A-like isoform X2 n=1 Tax=Gordionus sp. m RMFG-2023 TaxID=3053472 RepID=UPI0030DFE53B